MKSENRYLKYLLIIVLIMVWGIIIFRILDKTSKKEKFIKKEALTPLVNQLNITDSFSLLVDYPDPFLADLDTVDEPSKSPDSKNLAATSIPPDYSFIKFEGVISGGPKKRKFAMINFRNHDLILKEKEEIEGFKVIKIAKDSLVLGHDGKHISIKKLSS